MESRTRLESKIMVALSNASTFALEQEQIQLSQQSFPYELRQYYTSFLKSSGDYPCFHCPLAYPGVADNRQTLPLLLTTPGLDGVGVSLHRQLGYLQEVFDLEVLFTPNGCHTTFSHLVEIVKERISAEREENPNRPIFLFGESFGGLLSLAVAAEVGDALTKVIVVNPATCYQRSNWPQLSRLISDAPSLLYNTVIPAMFVASQIKPELTVSCLQYLQDSAQLQARKQGASSDFDYVYMLYKEAMGWLGELTVAADFLPRQTLINRLKLLKDGTEMLDTRYHKISSKVLLVVGEDDGLIPSKEEARFLISKIPDCQLRSYPRNGHYLLFEGVNLVTIMKDEGFFY